MEDGFDDEDEKFDLEFLESMAMSILDVEEKYNFEREMKEYRKEIKPYISKKRLREYYRKGYSKLAREEYSNRLSDLEEDN